jgi:hypothetical protein
MCDPSCGGRFPVISLTLMPYPGGPRLCLLQAGKCLITGLMGLTSFYGKCKEMEILLSEECLYGDVVHYALSYYPGSGRNTL